MQDAFICDAIRTPIGRYAGALASIRADDLGALPLRALMARNPEVDWSALDDVIYGCANQAGEDNRNVARMSALLAGLPITAPGVTVNRLCGSGMEAVGQAARAIMCGAADFLLAGGVESMSRAPLVMPKAESAFSREAAIYDTTIGWRFVNQRMHQLYGTESMPETAENVAQRYHIARADQDQFAWRSQQRYARALALGRFESEIIPVDVVQRNRTTLTLAQDEHPRADATMAALAALKAPFRAGGSITAGNASGVNDGACALLLASEQTVKQFDLKPRARVLGMAAAGVEPGIMGMGPVPASQLLLRRLGLTLAQMDVIELNEAFAAQALAVMRALQLPDDAPWVNPNGGAIALGHPLGMSGARLVATAVQELTNTGGRYALCTMCVGVGQGLAIVVERV